MKVIAPNKSYTGVSASVMFANGVGETDNPHLIQWFRDHGYTVEDRADIPPDPKQEAEEGEQKKPVSQSGSRKNRKSAKKAQPDPKQEAEEEKQLESSDATGDQKDSDNMQEPDAMPDPEGEQ